MKRTLKEWLKRKWTLALHKDLVRSYNSTFSSYDGQLVLNHLLDGIYFKTYEGLDPYETVIHNARRSVVHEILENIDLGEHPEKYNLTVQTEENIDAR